MASRMWTPKQVAEYTGLSEGTLANRRYMRRQPAFYKVGSSIRYDSQEIKTWWQSCRQEPTR